MSGNRVIYSSDYAVSGIERHTTATRSTRNLGAGLLALLAVLIAVSCDSERTPSSPEVPDRPPVVVAAGDIASCRSEGDEATAQVLLGMGPTRTGTVLALGDLAFPAGSTKNFERCYEPSWGRFKGRTKPVPGVNEYYTEGAAGYFDYFGEVAGEPGKGYYSYDLDGWHMIALNSNCEKVGGCYYESPQSRWLREDLAANDDKACTLAYFNLPLFTSGKYRPGVPKVENLWKSLYEAGADVVLSAADHNYQRFAPQDPTGKADPKHGIREFVVGTGGGKENDAIGDPIANSEVHNDDTDGVLKLTLRPEGYEWRFVPVAGKTFTDTGSAKCH